MHWMEKVSNKDVWERTNFERDIKQMGLSWKELERITQDRRGWREVMHGPEPGRSTLNVLNYKYKYFLPQKYLSTSTFLFGEMYLSTFRVLSKCT